jgi:hypothetical protein
LGDVVGNVTVSFDYGTSLSYNLSKAVASYGNTTAFTGGLTGLTPGTVYHFRAKAIGNGTSYGGDLTFTTLNTMTGSNMLVNVPCGSVEFTTVSGNGYTTSTALSSPSICSSYLNDYYLVRYYQGITTTATYSGNVTVAISFAGYTSIGNLNSLRMLHCNGTAWVDVTQSVDVANSLVYGTSSSLSDYVVVDPSPPTNINTQTRGLAQVAVLMIVIALVLALVSVMTVGLNIELLVILAIIIIVGVAMLVAAWAGIP